MNKGALRTKFLKLLNNSRCTPTLADGFLESGIARCQRKLRCPAMEQGVNVTIGSDYSGLWIPSDFLELVRLENSEGCKLARKPLDFVRFYALSTGLPLFFARQVNKWILGPTPVEDDTVRIDYYREFDGLVGDADDNILTIIAPDLPIYAALGFAADYFTDERAPLFETRFMQMLEELNDQGDNDDLSEASVAQAHEYPDDF